MTKFFTEKVLGDDCVQYVFTGEDARYLTDILRIRAGETVTLCDGKSTDYLLRVTEIIKGSVTAQTVSSQRNDTEPPYHAVLCQAIAKGEKMEMIIQKATELGVTRIIPVICDRCVARPSANDLEKKRERWQKIALEAARQCGRGVVPTVDLPLAFDVCLRKAVEQASVTFIPWEAERSALLSDIIDPILTRTEDRTENAVKPDIRFFIGPEGGFSPEEISAATNAGVRTVSLGRRILRTETAGLFVLSSLVYRLETF